MGAWHFLEAGMAVYWRLIFGERAHLAAAICNFVFPHTFCQVAIHCKPLCASPAKGTGLAIAKAAEIKACEDERPLGDV